MMLQDYDDALVARGFDGYQPEERTQMINHGYRYVSRKYSWAWEQWNRVFTINPGDPPIAMAGASALGADNVVGCYIATNPYRRKLTVMKQDTFERQWLPLDYTDPQNASAAPSWYYVFNELIYFLPMPQTAMDIQVYFKNYMPDMVAAADTPVTPQILDEMILDAALVRAHRRAHELDLAQEAQGRVNEAISDMLQDDVWVMEEQQERVLPDNQWL